MASVHTVRRHHPARSKNLLALLALLLSTLLLMLAARISHAGGAAVSASVTENDRQRNNLFADRPVHSFAWGDGTRGGTEVNVR